ncbi:hypothetical protein Tco_0707741 [Tanacetum coccineum]
MPRDCLRIIENKSKVRNSHNKPVVAKVSLSTSTPGISPDVIELKDMVKALLLDKKSQAPTPVKAVEESCVTCGGSYLRTENCPAPMATFIRDIIQRKGGYSSPLNNSYSDPSPPPNQGNYFPEIERTYFCEAKSSLIEPPRGSKLKDLLSSRISIFEGDDKCPSKSVKDLSVEEKATLHKARSRDVMLDIFMTWSKRRWTSLWEIFCLEGNSFENCLSRLDKILQRCEDTNLCLNWEKSHFMVKEGIVLGHKILKNGIEVDKAKIDVIAKFLSSTMSPIFEASRARSFCPSITRASNPQLSSGNRYG